MNLFRIFKLQVYQGEVRDRWEAGTYKADEFPIFEAKDGNIISWLKKEGHISLGANRLNTAINRYKNWMTIDKQNGLPLLEVVKVRVE